VIKGTEASMPEQYPESTRWTETEINLVLDAKTDESEIQKIVSFFDHLNVKYVSDATVKKMYENGFTSIPKILESKAKDYKNIPGLGVASGKRIVDNIKETLFDKPVELSKIMAGSCIFGVGLGEKKLKLVIDNYPDILMSDETDEEITEKVEMIEGFASKTAKQFAAHRKEFLEFLSSLTNVNIKLPSTEADRNERVGGPLNNNAARCEERRTQGCGVLSNKNIVFTGFRNQEMQTFVEEQGGKVTTAVSGKTNILVTKEKGSGSTKEEKAKKLKIEILTPEEFREKYMNE
jgi:DNA ligase (NAD+)